MSAQLRAELLEQRSTRTNIGLLAGLLGLVLFAVLLHGFGLPSETIDGTSEQLMVLGRGAVLAVLFAGFLGAMSITAEIRHGTIRPTFLVNPRRGRVIAAKVAASTLAGAGFGLAAGAVAVGAGAAALGARGSRCSSMRATTRSCSPAAPPRARCGRRSGSASVRWCATRSLR